MKKWLWFLIPALVIALIGGITSMGKIPNGQEGVIVSNMASSEATAIKSRTKIGYFFKMPFQELFLFPTFTQQHAYTQAQTEGSPTDEAFRVQFNGGAVGICDIGISWYIRPGEATKAFKKYRQGADEITRITLRRVLREGFQQYGPFFSVDDMYSGKMPALMDSVTKYARAQLSPHGVEVEQVALLKAPVWDPKIKATMEAKIEAIQNAIKVENEVRTIQAEADKAIAKARGDSASVVIAAQGAAEAVRIQSQRWGSSEAYLKYETNRMWSDAWQKGGSPMPTTVLGGGTGMPPILFDLKK